MKIAKFKWLVFLELFFLFSARAVFAQSMFGDFDPIKFIFGPDVPSEWYQPYMFMQWLVFPFIGIWLVLYGIMEQLGIFRTHRSIGGFLALIMALVSSSTGGLVILARALFVTMGGWGLLVFFAVFMVGVTAWGYGEIQGRWSAKDYVKQYEQEIKTLQQRKISLEERWRAEQDPNKANKLMEELTKVDAELETKREKQMTRYGHG